MTALKTVPVPRTVSMAWRLSAAIRVARAPTPASTTPSSCRSGLQVATPSMASWTSTRPVIEALSVRVGTTR